MTLAASGFSGLIPITEINEDAAERVRQFSCGREALDKYLDEEASDFHSEKLSHTSLIFHEDFPGLAGYITLCHSSIPLVTSEVGDLGLNFKTTLNSFPAILICRLAVHRDLQGQGVGAALLEQAMGQIIATPTISSVRLMITDAINDPKVIKFYQDNGFIDSYWAADMYRRGDSRTKERATIKMLRDIYGG